MSKSKAKLMLGNPSDHVDFETIESPKKPILKLEEPEVPQNISKKKSFNEDSVRM